MRKKEMAQNRWIDCAFLHFSACGAVENGESNYRFARADFFSHAYSGR